MAERRRTVAVGATMLVGLVGLLTMLWLFSEVPEWLGRTYQVTLKLPNAGGVQAGNRVLLSGIDVGEVERVELVQPVSQGVRVICRIREEIVIPAQAEANIDRPLVGGSTRVALDVPEEVDREAITYLARDGTAELRGDVPTLAGSLGYEMRQALEGPVGHLDRATASFERLSGEWERVGQNINVLLEPRERRPEGEGGNPEEEIPLANVPEVLAELDARLSQAEHVLAGAQRYLADDALYEDVRQTVANTREASEAVNESVERLTAAGERHMEELSAQYIALADDLSAGVQGFERLVEQMEEGEGTLGLLLNDPRLYENLDDAAERVQSAIDEVRLLVQRWRVEGVPVRW